VAVSFSLEFHLIGGGWLLCGIRIYSTLLNKYDNSYCFQHKHVVIGLSFRAYFGGPGYFGDPGYNIYRILLFTEIRATMMSGYHVLARLPNDELVFTLSMWKILTDGHISKFDCMKKLLTIILEGSAKIFPFEGCTCFHFLTTLLQ
jgi:hypothetical protein